MRASKTRSTDFKSFRREDMLEGSPHVDTGVMLIGCRAPTHDCQSGCKIFDDGMIEVWCNKKYDRLERPRN